MKKILIATALLSLTASSLLKAQTASGQWDEIVGKTIVNAQGKKLGTVVDSVVDLENGRYLGMVVSTGGFLGLGSKTIIVPPAALQDHGIPHRLHLDMTLEKFRSAPLYELPKTVGPPDSSKVAEVFRFFGQTPPFAILHEPKPANAAPLGHLRKTSEILLMSVENLQGLKVGYVEGLRGLNRVTQSFEGVVIQPAKGNAGMKIVPPQSLRYKLKNNRLRINDHAQPFRQSSNFSRSRTGAFVQENPARPGTMPPPLVQGESPADKATSTAIDKRILADRNLTIYGKNIEVATLDGKTTLRGRVANEANRTRIIGYAQQIAGADNVIEQIEVRPMSEAEKAIDR
jgi:sporulation protein YlmC with PRC-barrel domain